MTTTGIRPQIELTYAPRELNANDWYETFSVLGVARRHILYANADTLEFLYVVAPEGGSYRYLQEWADTPHTFPAWRLMLWSPSKTKWEAAYDLQVEAERWVHLQAIAEVRAEFTPTDTTDRF